MEECLRRVAAMYLPAARHQLLAKNGNLDARVLWVDATAAPCMYAATVASTETGASQFGCPEASAVPAVQCCISIKTACSRGDIRVLRAGSALLMPFEGVLQRLCKNQSMDTLCRQYALARHSSDVVEQLLECDRDARAEGGATVVPVVLRSPLRVAFTYSASAVKAQELREEVAHVRALEPEARRAYMLAVKTKAADAKAI